MNDKSLFNKMLRLKQFVTVFSLLIVPAALQAQGTALLEIENVKAQAGEVVEGSISMTVDVDVTRLTFDLVYGAAPVRITKVSKGERNLAEDPQHWNDEGDRARISVFLFGETVIPAGSGDVLMVEYTLDADAPDGSFPITIENLQVVQTVLPVSTTWTDGTLTVGGCECDLNSDALCTATDALCSLQTAVGICPTSCGPCAEMCCDATEDGFCSASDALCRLQQAVNIHPNCFD